MISLIQILLCLSSIYWATCVPIFGEFRFRKNFEVEHKPIPLPPFIPIELIKEIVTPFGKFGMKHGIGKRDLDNMKTVDVEPEKVSVMPLPAADNRYEVIEHSPVPFLPSPVPPMMVPVTAGMGPVIANAQVSPQMEMPHFVEIKPIPAPPRPPVVITPPTPKVEQPPRGFHTDIAREEAINEYLKLVEREPVVPLENNIEQEKPKEIPKVEEPPNPFIRGSRLALYFGNVLLDVFTQFLGGSRFAELLNRPVTI